MGSSRMAMARFQKRFEDFWTLRKREIFFGVVAAFALSQIFLGEYRMRVRKQELIDRTPQKSSKLRIVESIQADAKPYELKSEWKR